MRVGLGRGRRGVEGEHKLGGLDFLWIGSERKIFFQFKHHHFLLVFRSCVLSTIPTTWLDFSSLQFTEGKLTDQDAMVADTELGSASISPRELTCSCSAL